MDAKSSSSSPPKPGTEILAVVVDRAAREVLSLGRPSKAAGSSREVYSWLGINWTGANFPTEVRSAFPPVSRSAQSQAQPVKPERLAKYHKYGPGAHVIHAVGPVLRDLEQSVRDLTKAYAATLEEFCRAIGPPVEADGLPTASTKAAFMSASVKSKMPAGSIVSRGNGYATNETNETPPRDAPLILRMEPLSFMDNKKLAHYRAQIFWTSLAIALERLPLAMQRRLQEATIEVCVKPPDDKLYEEAMLIVPGALQIDRNFGCISKHEGSYEWVRKANAPQDRMERLAASSLTMQAVYQGGYYMPNGRAVALRSVDAMTANTSIHQAGCETSPRPAGRKVASLAFAEGTVMQVAVHLAKLQKSTVVAVNAASAYHVGGGVLTGGRHALEESWCITSTLLKSLQQAQYMSTAGEEAFESPEAIEADGGFVRYLPDDGVVCSPLVEVFRTGYQEGYAFLPEATVLPGVISVAMYNRNPRVRDSPVDAPGDELAYQTGVRRKFQAMIEGALQLGAETLVLPDIGCGVFRNDPEILGSLLGEMLKSGPASGHLQQVILTGQRSFAEAAHRVYTSGQGEPLQTLSDDSACSVC
eukprot:TRINITY_DN40497_c0_g1_i1.p1 TRINITY_DN40497_c0_g1~~TRINITY_DN40497_c0_g1_i1.p1  ORF type:complete len:679 (+),score=127.12 TRINITY_DN40497_c0_g1_i1:275-2038(+)